LFAPPNPITQWKTLSLPESDVGVVARVAVKKFAGTKLTDLPAETDQLL
jgi:hypothetical protein